jgi:hypothetical protein
MFFILKDGNLLHSQMKEDFIHRIWPTYHSTSRLVPHASVVHIPIYVGSCPIHNGRRPMSCQFTNGPISRLRTGDLFKLVTSGPTPPLSNHRPTDSPRICAIACHWSTSLDPCVPTVTSVVQRWG